MLKFDTIAGKFEHVPQSNLKENNLLERYDLQTAIVGSWDLFKNEIGFPSAFLIGQEITPDNTTQNSIDLLAYDADDSSLIVIELKRDKNKLQLLQSLSYAAMVAKWDTETILKTITNNSPEDSEELIDLVESNVITTDVKVILVAEQYDPEVIVTADWLTTSYGLNISAFALSLHTLNDQTFIDLDQRYPLRELSDVYDSRKAKKRSKARTLKNLSWDDVIPKLAYDFGKTGIEICLKHNSGDAPRRRFSSIRTNFDGFTWITINFRAKYINVYMKGVFDSDHELINSKFSDTIELSRWRDGSNFNVTTQQQFEELIVWLQL
ncbi:hypothetical protein N9M08_01830 [Porticoccaceae bacterium]|nr:hypothetical protein [Porticoccaceae bacterium]MDA8789075.1 hypothetical protein [Porticoccaceae bacterium]MDB2343554.1 hypothetical protein [Porticoccaceae bacterium]MDB2664836.1 hypothetical protein [Porticoccaceae bacterium]